ncbi:fasciclin domain-containing protein [Neolewinella antarctica]|uniref:Surface protein with fasciclin (FAS1) repeats n=1 Tax=Neolewinella antarctica TaxID=442734 RepID=A0ABX0XAH9_9BACT|nr:fasciclin domain-containing protein [Neolewinella antarctica]NJC26281.1 putative surface protein with fasciclin (FAS1) repeats [Neolewinella antarctica]
MRSLFFLLLVTTGFASSGLHAQEALPTITDALSADSTTTTLYAALDAADLSTALAEDREVILLAPTDDAFASIPSETMAKLLDPQNVSSLRTILTYHLLEGGEQGASDTATRASDGGATLGEVIECSNGVVYLIDRVLLPPGFDLSELVD